MKCNIIFAFACLFILQSCVEKKEKLQVANDKILTTSEHQIICRNILSSRDILRRDYSDLNQIGTVDTVLVKEIEYSQKKIFIYTNKRTADTLLSYIDSIYKYNNQILRFLGSKKMVSGNDSINILKYRYLHDGAKSKPANLYISKKLGLIVLQARSQWGWVVEYDTAYEDLHKEILTDSVFFDFKYEYEY